MNPIKCSIYIHWPFCAKKCYFCDLSSFVDPEHNGLRYLNAMIKELHFHKNKYPDLRIETIFIGGGTPSLMRPEWIKKLIDEVAQLWSCDSDLEVTMEINPRPKLDLQGFRDAGINRASFGVQSFQDRILQFLGRDHSKKHAIDAISKAKEIFPRVSIDLIYGIPGQSLQDIEENLRYIKDLQLKHVSMYALTIEKNTAFGLMDLKLPEDEEFCQVYDFITSELPKMGLNQYEISSFAAYGQECRHNIIYWNYGQWLPVGPSACGRMIFNSKRVALENIKQPRRWLEATENNQYAEEVYLEDALKEEYLMKLRIRTGLTLADADRMQLDRARIKKLEECGNLESNESGFRLTTEGWLKYNSLARYLWSGEIHYD